MGFRDDNQALRARIQTLESEKAQLSEEKRRLETALEGKVPKEDATLEEIAAQREPLSLHDTIMDRVSKRNAREQTARQKKRAAKHAKHAKAIGRLQKRKQRVRVESASGGSLVNVRPGVLGDQLREQLPWGFGFALINPGIFVVVGLAFFYAVQFDMAPLWLVIAPLVTWVILLTLINVVYAKWKSPPYRLELTDKHFALYKRGKKPILFGTLAELKVDAPEPNPAQLHRVRVSDGRGDEAIDNLSAKDVGVLNSAIRSARKSKKTKKKQRE